MGTSASNDERTTIITQSTDNPITKKEMETYVLSQLSLRQKEMQKLQEELVRVQQAYDGLMSKYMLLVQQVKEEKISTPNVITSVIDEKAIDIFVQGLIDDPNVNIHGVPDFIERAMYKKLAKSCLVGLEKVFDNISFELMGHKVRLIIEPECKYNEKQITI
jgi:hypothetical protein